MIDVVFLLLVFFMLAARFGQDGALPLSLAAGGDGDWSGPPRLVQIRPDDLTLNGRALPAAALVGALTDLMASPGDLVLLRAADGADMQRLLDVIAVLEAGGVSNLALVDR